MEIKSILEKEFNRLYEINNLMIPKEGVMINSSLYEAYSKNVLAMCEIVKIIGTNEPKEFELEVPNIPNPILNK